MMGSPDPSTSEFVRRLVHERSAIVIDASKDYLVQSRLAPVARDAGLGGVDGLVEHLRRQPASPLRDVVVDAMTTNETSFFRDAAQWEALATHVLPELIERRRAQRTLTLWSAACSSGQEPYSIAMLMADRFPRVVAEWNVRIVASDLSAEMLGRAAAGRYSQLEVNRGLPAPYLVRYFRQVSGQWEVRDEVRQLVEFRALNLVEPWPGLPPVDVLCMRNVLIYFDAMTKRRVLSRVHDVLRPDGHLMLGTAESTLYSDERFRRVEFGRATTYQRRTA